MSSIIVAKHFPKPASYLKAYVLGIAKWREEDLDRLQRYARGEVESLRYSFEGMTERFDYGMFQAAGDLTRVCFATRREAIHGAISGGAEWREAWMRQAAYGYWAMRMNARIQQRIRDDFEAGRRKQYLPTLALHSFGFVIADCLIQGWTDYARDLGTRTCAMLDAQGFFDGNDEAHRRTQHFVLRLIADWKGLAWRSSCTCAHDEPTFNALIESWRTTDVEQLAGLLINACNLHTQNAKHDSNNKWHDLCQYDYWYVPFEVLAVLKIRQLEGLQLPDLKHPLMDTPLGALPPDTPVYTDALIEGVVARARTEHPDL